MFYSHYCNDDIQLIENSDDDVNYFISLMLTIRMRLPCVGHVTAVFGSSMTRVVFYSFVYDESKIGETMGLLFYFTNPSFIDTCLALANYHYKIG